MAVGIGYRVHKQHCERLLLALGNGMVAILESSWKTHSFSSFFVVTNRLLGIDVMALSLKSLQ
jgi:hypothetical protein